MQEEREALQASHSEQLESLRLQFDKEIEQMKLEHSQKVRAVHVSWVRPVVVYHRDSQMRVGPSTYTLRVRSDHVYVSRL